MNKTKSHLIEKGITAPESCFIFNLGRLWQEVISEHWDDAQYLNDFIKEVTLPTLKKRYSKELKNLQIAINRESRESVDKQFKRILLW